MAAPILRWNRECLFSLCQGKFDSKARCLSTLPVLFGKTQNDVQKQRTVSRRAVSSSSPVANEKINIPDKIARSPTAILEALAKTVRSDVNKPVYQSIDDPALLSRSDGLLKHHLAALDNGRKAAQAMIAMNPEYYTHFWDVPLPQGVDAVFSGYEHQEENEDALRERIHWRKVADSVDMYKAIKSQGGELSQETLESFLDLLTVYNHQDPDDISDLSNFITPQFDMDSPFPVNSWPKGNLAEDVFQSMPEKSSRAYCALICGIAENNNKQRAMELYRQARDANVSVDVFTYNKLVAIVSLDMESMEDIREEITVLLKDMASSDVTPNVETFNAVLKNCRRISRWRGTKQYALSVLQEMKACGIRPSLGTWVEILNIFYYHKDKSPRTPDLFENMLDLMKDQSYECEGPRDIFFFRTAMRVLSTHLPDSRIVLKLHNILTSHRNFDFIGHRQLRYAYFKELFLVVAPVEHTDDVMAIYDSVVPYIFMPHMDVYKALFENIETYDTYYYLPQLCADLDASNFYMERGAIILYRLMARVKHESQLQNQFCDIASAFLARWEDSKLNRISPYLDGGVIGDMILVFLYGDQLAKAQSAFQMYRSNRKLQVTDPSDEALQALAEALMTSNNFTATKDLLTFMSNLSYENVPELVSKALETFQLSDQESNYLQGLGVHSSSDSSSSSSSESDSD